MIAGPGRGNAREGQQLEQLVLDLSRDFAQAPVEEVRTTVATVTSGFDRAAVRDFVPILVARQARTVLGQRYR